MRSRTATLSLASWACVSALLATAAAAEQAPPQWIALRSGDVEIYSDTDEQTTVDFAVKLQRMRAAMVKVGRFAVTTQAPTRVFLFRSGGELAPLIGEMFGTQMNRSGVFTSRGGRHDIAIDASARIRSERALYHELTHSLVASAFRNRVPLWMNEGLAEFYSTFNTEGNVIFVGKPTAVHMVRILRSQQIPMRELLEATTQSENYTNAVRQRLFYAESWAMVHYVLRLHRDGPEQLMRYVDLVASGTPIERAFEQSFGLRVDEMNVVLREYMRRADRAGWFRFTLDELRTEPVSSPRAVPAEEIRLAIDELLGRRNPAAEAAERRKRFEARVRENVTRANREIAEGRTEDAIATLWWIVAVQQDGELKLRAAELAERLERERARAAFIERYNAAVDMANAGDHAGALAAVEALMPELVDEDLCESAGALRHWLTVDGSRLTGYRTPRKP